MANDSYQMVVRNAPQSGLAAGQVIALEDDVLTLGRDPLSDIILDDPEVSRHHARLMLQAGGYAIQDMGSTNGSFVDGKRLAGEPVLLKPGQVVMLGSNVTLVYQAIPAVDPMATVVAPVAAAVEPEVVDEEVDLGVEEVVQDIEVDVVEEVEPPEPIIAAAAVVEEPEPDVIPAELVEEPDLVVEEIVEELDEEEDFATMMDVSPFATSDDQEIVEPEPLPELPPEPEPLPELPVEPVADLEPPSLPDEPIAAFDELDERTYIDSAAPVSDLMEEPIVPLAAEMPPSPPPPLSDLEEPKPKSSNNRNIIIVAVVIILLICCCLAILAGVAAFTDVLSTLNF